MRALLALLLLTPAMAFAQVYKCKGKSGETVYSQDPCSSGAQPHVMRDGQLAGSSRRLDRQCLAEASARIYAGANDRTASLQQQITQLAAEGNHGVRIAQLRQGIVAENAQANRSLTQARAGCMRDVASEPAPEPDAPPAREGNQADT